jgi:hypothetical protein
MRRRNGEGANADQIASGAKDLDLLSGEVWNLSAILQVLRVAKRNNAINRIFDAAGQVLDSAMRQCCALTVAAREDRRVGTVSRSLGQEIAHFPDSTQVCTSGEKVSGEQGRIVNALDGNAVGAKDLLKATGGRRSNDGAL